MRKYVLAAVLVLLASGAQASSYLDTFGTVHNPIQTTGGAVHSYSGPNFEPNAALSGVSLLYPSLNSANLSGANLNNAQLYFSDLTNADLTGADMQFADLNYSDLTGANLANSNLWKTDLLGVNLTGANLAGALFLGDSWGFADYDASTDFTGTGFDPVAAGWNLVPEPNRALLLGLGLVDMAGYRRL